VPKETTIGVKMLCKRITFSAAFSVLLLLSSCKRTSAPAVGITSAAVDLATLPGTIFKVTYNDHTVMVDEVTVRQTLRSVSKNGNVLVFDPSPQIQKLQPGSVLFMQGLAVRKVLATMPFESETTLLTVPAAVTDASQEGQIHWDYPVRFSANSASSDPLGSPLQGNERPASAQFFRTRKSA